MWMVGVDADPIPSYNRGLVSVAYAGSRLSTGSLAPTLVPLGLFDAAVLMGVTGREHPSSLWKEIEQLAEIVSVMKPKAYLIVEDGNAGFEHSVASKILAKVGLRLVCDKPGFCEGSVMWIAQNA
jgi:hypothetical protein